MIESVNNERVKYWTKLNDKKYQIEYGLFLVEGEHLVMEAKKAGLLEEVIILNGFDFDYENKTYVNTNVMKKISTLTNIPRIIGVVRMIEPRDILGNVLLLDGIQNPGNMGTIIRSAVAFDIDTIIIGEDSVSIYNPKVIRATEGMLFHINIVKKDLTIAITELRNNGYKIYTTDVEGGVELSNVNFNKHTGIVIGNEGAGVKKEIKE